MTNRVRRCECGERIAYVEDVFHADRPPTGRLIHIDLDDREVDRGHPVIEGPSTDAQMDRLLALTPPTDRTSIFNPTTKRWETV